jgi:spore coat protein U-like protein
MRRSLLWSLPAGLVCALAGSPAFAIGESCSVTATALAFGNFAPLSGTVLNAMSTITVTCVCPILCLGINYTVAVSTGGSGTFSPRRMSAGTPTLAYNGYTTAARTTIWGDGTGSTAVQARCRLVGAIGSSWVEPITFYGRIPVNTAAIPGSYMDTLNVTVTYTGISLCIL